MMKRVSLFGSRRVLRGSGGAGGGTTSGGTSVLSTELDLPSSPTHHVKLSSKVQPIKGPGIR